jgi:hypothetical protein
MNSSYARQKKEAQRWLRRLMATQQVKIQASIKSGYLGDEALMKAAMNTVAFCNLQLDIFTHSK